MKGKDDNEIISKMRENYPPVLKFVREVAEQAEDLDVLRKKIRDRKGLDLEEVRKTHPFAMMGDIARALYETTKQGKHKTVTPRSLGMLAHQLNHVKGRCGEINRRMATYDKRRGGSNGQAAGNITRKIGLREGEALMLGEIAEKVKSIEESGVKGSETEYQKVLEALEFLNSDDVKQRLEALKRVGESSFVSEIEAMRANAQKIKAYMETKINVLDTHHESISGLDMGSGDLQEVLRNLINDINRMMEELRRRNPNDSMVKAIEANKTMLHLIRRFEGKQEEGKNEKGPGELDWLQEKLEGVKRSLKQKNWEDFRSFYHNDKPKVLEGHLKKVREEFGDEPLATVLEQAGENTKEYGDQPLRWALLLYKLYKQLTSDEYMGALVKMGQRVVLQLIEGEKTAFQEKVAKILKARVDSMEAKIAKEMKNIDREIEKILGGFFKTTLREHRKKVVEVAKVYEDHEDVLTTISRFNIDREIASLRIVHEHKETALTRLARSLGSLKGSLRGIARDPTNPYNFAAIFQVQQMSVYLDNLEDIEERDVNILKERLFGEMPPNLEIGLKALLRIRALLIDALSYLESRGFIEDFEKELKMVKDERLKNVHNRAA